MVLLAVFWPTALLAHEMRPGYLEMHEDKPAEFSVLWKTPMAGDARLSLQPEISGETTLISPVVSRTVAGAMLQEWTVRAPSLRGQTLRIRGLESTMTDALVRIEFADGTSWTQRLTARQPSAVVPARQSTFAVGSVYVKLGVEHILTGVDHLLFVLALIILAEGTWRLVETVTAFTLAHSITLGLAALGFVHVPQKPVEAVIALSIAFVAAEIVHRREGRVGLAARAPWVVAFVFGLLHGLGFAGTLSEVGLPQGHIPLALFCFNAGVEIGQLLFVTTVLTVVAALRRVRPTLPAWIELVPAYGIGITAAFWIIQRTVSF
ncbi:MAG TPA: HupE/UreJ family protein [Candidatus Acidoferrales bacterium]|nr:HupE/UreJ family protein [Candidatus Acidoferrales bacterium]